MVNIFALCADSCSGTVTDTVNLCQVCQVEGEGYSVSLLADDLVRAVHSMLVQTSTVLAQEEALPLDLVLESKRFNASSL